MDSSPVLRQQSQNKIRSDFMRMKNENNKMPAHPKSSKLLSAPHLSNQDIENKDPGNSEMGRKVPVRPGGSRLPVLAKSLRLQTPSDFSQAHCRWEEKPLAGKAKKKKACTRPVPFNLSQPKSSRTVTENQQPLPVSQSRTGAIQPENNVFSTRLKTQNIHAKPTKHPAALNSNVDSTKGTGKSNGKATENTSKLSEQSGPSNTLKTSSTLSHPLSSIPNNTMHQSSATSSAQAAVNAEACLDNMNLLSLKDQTMTSHVSQNMQLTAQGKGSTAQVNRTTNHSFHHEVESTPPTVSTKTELNNLQEDKGENFQPDHAALLSILRNEGVSATGLGSATPQTKPYNYLPQRVSVMKSRQKAGPTTGSMKSVQFSPDSAALQSILQNEGVKVGGPVGATHRNSVRASDRGTSIYSAQRVPVRKIREEATRGPGAAAALKESPLNKWTPQRVRNTRHQPMSAMKWHPSTQKSSYAGSPGLQSSKTNPQQQQEQEVVQRLFDDQEDEQRTNVTEKESMKSVQFSPDSAALQSILQNEGVKVGGPVGPTHRNSVRASGRGTSVYSAQRVPVRKNRTEATGGPGAGAPKETPLNKCTPQRVRNTRHQPMSAMKWHLSTQKSPYAGTPGQQSGKTNPQQQQEEVVQRLFDDQEDERSTDVTDKDPETQAEQLPDTTTKSCCEEKVGMSGASSNEDEEQRIVGGQPFIQAPQRESVIFFSTGKKLLRAPRFEQQGSSADHEEHGPVSSEQRKVLPVHEEPSSVSEPTCQIKPSVQNLHRDLIVQKTCALGPAVAMLRKRLPPLEELRLDEEVATYTSVSVPAVPGFLPPRPRCGNPLAAILHFEESTRFVPIVCDLSSGPSSPQRSPQER